MPIVGALLEISIRLVARTISPRPVVKPEGNNLVLKSSWRTALLTLGGRSRKVTINPKAKFLRIADRRFWLFFSSRVIPFDRVDSVIYRYMNPLQNEIVSHDQEDIYTVGLQLKDGKSLSLFKFWGMGEFVNNSILPDWMFPIDHLPGKVVQHNMEGDSGDLADLLALIIDVPVTQGEV